MSQHQGLARELKSGLADLARGPRGARFRMPKTPRLQGEMYRGVAEVEGLAVEAE